MNKKLKILFTNEMWGISPSRLGFTSLKIVKRGDSYCFDLKEGVESFESVKRIYNQNPSSYLVPFIPSEPLPAMTCHQSSIKLPMSRRNDINEAWQEYIPQFCLKEGKLHKKVVISKEKGESNLQIFSFSDAIKRPYLSKQVPLSVCMLALHQLFDVDPKRSFLFLYLDEDRVYATLVKQGIIQSFLYSPHLNSIDDQLAAIALYLKENEPYIYPCGNWGNSVHNTLAKHFPTLVNPGLKSTVDICSETLVLHAPLVGATLSTTLGKYSKASVFTSLRNWLQFKRPVISLYFLSIVCFTFMLVSAVKEYTINKQEVLSSIKQLNKSSPQQLASEDEISNDPEHLLSKLQESLNHTKQLKIPFSLVPPLPELSDLFAWLQTYPSDHLHIKNVSYKLTEFPSTKSPHRKYSAKVSIELNSNSPDLADTFQKSLINDSGFVNRNKPFNWKANQQLYLISFYLSDRGGGL